jgi:hypothetical protein
VQLVNNEEEKIIKNEQQQVEIKPKVVQAIDIFRNFFFHRSEEDWGLRGNSLFIFEPSNRFRKICYAICEERIVQIVIFLLIILQTVTLALADPLSDPNSEMNQILFKIDVAISVIFIFESCLKIISLGFLFNGSYSYLRRGWN